MKNLSNFLNKLSDRYAQIYFEYLKYFLSMYDS